MLFRSVKVTQSCPALCDPMDYTVHELLQARILEWVAIPFSRGSFQPRDQTPRSPALQSDSLPAEPQGKPKNTGVGSHFLLQGIFLTQGLNPGLLHCRQILHCLRHQGSPIIQQFIPASLASGFPCFCSSGFRGYNYLLR